MQLVPGSPEVRGHTSSGTTAVVWGTPGMDPGWTPPTLGPLGWTLDGPLPISLLPPDLVKCQLLIRWSGWAGNEVVAWALLEIELIQNVNHHLSAFISSLKHESDHSGGLKVENSKRLEGFPLGFT